MLGITLLYFFSLLVLASLWCFGVYIACQYDKEEVHQVTRDGGWDKAFIIKNKMLLWWFGYACESLPWWLSKPLCKCVTCMASIHGTLIFFLYFPLEYSLSELLLIWPLFVGALAGLNQLIANKFDVE